MLLKVIVLEGQVIVVQRLDGRWRRAANVGSNSNEEL
jgi:hypothetical protein